MVNIQIDPEACVLCEACVDICVRRRLSRDGDAIKVAQEPCNLCGHCKALCPEDAITLTDLVNDEWRPVPDKEDIPEPEKLLAFFRTRRSTRRYKKDSVEKEKLTQIIEAGRFAPTGGNRQSLEYTVVETPDPLAKIRNRCVEFHAAGAEKLLAMLAEKEKRGDTLTGADLAMGAYAQAWPFRLQLLRQGTDTLFFGAPVLIVLHADVEASPGPEIDAGLAAMQMGLMAQSLGLGTCYNGFLIGAAQQSAELKKLLEIPEKNLPVVSFVAGYPNVHYERLVSRNPARIRWI
jgi:nitroreductase/NAD-dependent dihydropyrimidine dehydrogenase PreA subunit